MLTIVFELGELINQDKEELLFVDKIIRDVTSILIMGETVLTADYQNYAELCSLDACKTIEQYLDNNKDRVNDWFLIISNKKINFEKYGRQFVVCPYKFWSGLEQFNTKSFTEHAKSKYLYNELSWLYMESIVNDTYLEVNFLKTLFEENNVKKVMDCCCGVGRHAARLGELGIHVVGIDASSNQIQTALEKNNNENVEYIVHDVRNFNLPDKCYDAAICMWTTYNYFSKKKDILKFLSTVSAHLHDGGLLVLDSKNIPAMETYRFYHRETQKENLNMTLLVYKRILGMVQNSQYFYFINNGENKLFYLDEEFVRFYTVEELQKLNITRFELVNVYGDFHKNQYEPNNSERMITVWRKLP